MLAQRYLTSAKNLPAIMEAITKGTAPSKFTVAHLKSIGFKSSNDQGILAVLKELRFLSDDGTPLQRYHDYRDQSRSKFVMAEALRESYEELFHINEQLTDSDRPAIVGKFKSVHNVSDVVANRQAMTFLALLKLADLDAKDPVSAGGEVTHVIDEKSTLNDADVTKQTGRERPPTNVSLRYNVEVHLPATKDIEVYNAIFKSLREHLLDD